MLSKEIGHISDSGIRLRNPRFFSFLNSAVNAIVTNRKLRSQLLDDNTLKLWGENVLVEHDPNFSGGIEMRYEDVLHSLNAFASHPFGCTDFHSVNCFSTIKEQISSKLLESKVLKEMKRLIFSEESVDDKHLLRKLLSESFPLFKDDIQHEAGDAFSSILQCMPNSASLCS